MQNSDLNEQSAPIEAIPSAISTSSDDEERDIDYSMQLMNSVPPVGWTSGGLPLMCMPLVSENALTVRVVCRTWDKDSHDLYDYEASSVRETIYYLRRSVRVFREEQNLFMLPEEVVPSGGTFAGRLSPSSDGRVTVSTLDRSVPSNTLSSKLWVVVRDLPQCEHMLGEHDLVKLGRFRLRVRQICTDPDQPINWINDSGAILHEAPEPATKQCRICLCEGSDPADPLISPCKCRGSIRYLHASCLKYWIEAKHAALRNITSKFTYCFFPPVHCELCRCPFPTRIRVLPSHPLESPVENSPDDEDLETAANFSQVNWTTNQNTVSNNNTNINGNGNNNDTSNNNINGNNNLNNINGNRPVGVNDLRSSPGASPSPSFDPSSNVQSDNNNNNNGNHSFNPPSMASPVGSSPNNNDNNTSPSINNQSQLGSEGIEFSFLTPPDLSKSPFIVFESQVQPIGFHLIAFPNGYDLTFERQQEQIDLLNRAPANFANNPSSSNVEEEDQNNSNSGNLSPAQLEQLKEIQEQFFEARIGRGHESDIRISDVSISRVHAKLQLRVMPDGRRHFFLKDNLSKFGTLVSIRRIATVLLTQNNDPHQMMLLQNAVRSRLSVAVNGGIQFPGGHPLLRQFSIQVGRSLMQVSPVDPTQIPSNVIWTMNGAVGVDKSDPSYLFYANFEKAQEQVVHRLNQQTSGSDLSNDLALSTPTTTNTNQINNSSNNDNSSNPIISNNNNLLSNDSNSNDSQKLNIIQALNNRTLEYYSKNGTETIDAPLDYKIDYDFIQKQIETLQTKINEQSQEIEIKHLFQTSASKLSEEYNDILKTVEKKFDEYKIKNSLLKQNSPANDQLGHTALDNPTVMFTIAQMRRINPNFMQQNFMQQQN